MSESLYITTNETATGKRMVALGVMEQASRHFDRLAFFRPIVRYDAAQDQSIQLIRSRYQIQIPQEDMIGLNRRDARQLLAQDKYEDLLQTVLQRYKKIEEQADFVLVEGTSYRGFAPAFEFEMNADLAANLGCPVMQVYSAREKSVTDLLDSVRIGREQLESHGCKVLATLINQIQPDRYAEISAECQSLRGPGEDSVYALPEEPLLRQPTLREIRQALDAQLILGDPAGLDREVPRIKIAAMQLPEFISRMTPGSLVITPGDRYDILVGCLVSLLSHRGISPGGIVLTGGLMPPESIMNLISGLPNVPVFRVESDTFDTATKISQINAEISVETPRKVDSALGLFEKYVDQGDLVRRLAAPPPRQVTPLLFEYELIRRARSIRKRIVLPEGTEPRILLASDVLRRRDVVDLTLLGPLDAVRTAADTVGLSLDSITVIDPTTSHLREEFALAYYEMRKHKGITLDMARDRMQDESYFGTMMVFRGLADGMVSGAIHTTAHTIRPAFEFVKTRPDVSLVSSVFLMCLPDRVLVYGDCAVNPNPTAEQLADIAISSAETAIEFGIEPRVAMLSYSTGESGEGEDVDRVRQATILAKERRPDLLIDGPLQYDAAVDPAVARTKLPNSPVAGRATVFIFPDLNTGNNTYKAVQRSAKAVAIGPVLQGLRKPVNDLSRGCTVTDIVNTVAITAIQSHRL